MDDELFNEFINESREHLSTIEADLLTIEESGAAADPDLVNKVFRAAHSIKGGSGFLGLVKVKEVAHKAETILDMIRAKKIVPNAEVTNVLLGAFDRLRDMINRPADLDSFDIEDLLTSLTSLASAYLPAGRKEVLTATVALRSPGGRREVVLAQPDFERAQRSGQSVYVVEYDLIHDIEGKGINLLRFFRELEESGEILDCALDFEAAGTLDEPIGNRLPLRMVFATAASANLVPEILLVPETRIQSLSAPSPAPAQERPPSPPPADLPAPSACEPRERADETSPGPAYTEPRPASPVPGPDEAAEEERSRETAGKPAARGGAPATEETLRINVTLLETMMNLAGELVLGRNQLHAAIAQNNTRLLGVADQRINQVTSELQDAIMRTRLQPIGNVLGKFPRVVRDMAQALGKDIQVEIQGKDVALDKSMIEGLSDPLTHMIRNAADHGIESPEERRRSGKRAAGRIRIEARHEAGQVVVEIEDDGKGIDPRRVSESAVAKGLISAEKVRGMSDAEKQALIFLPGLSTAKTVSDLSGRGVGMDVVKTNLDHLGGTVEIKSAVGKGSLFRIKLPLTLAIIPSLVVAVGQERFAIPQANVQELIRIPAEDVKRRVEWVGDAEVLLLRDRMVPLVRFAEAIGLTPSYLDRGTGKWEIDRRQHLADRRSRRNPAPDEEGAEAGSREARPSGGPRARGSERRQSARSALEIAVVTTGTLEYGLVFDSFHDNEEIVVKPLGHHLKGLREYMGATILGDGTVLLILDITGLALKANLAAVSASARARQVAQDAERERLADLHSFLLFHNGPDEPCATPLETVLRVERIQPSQVEMAGGRRTMQYRGASLPLVTLADCARVRSLEDAKDLAVIVSQVRGREIGLLGAMPVDVIETKAVVDQMTHRQPGIVGSAIIRDRTTLVADLFELVDAAYPDWGAAETRANLAQAALARTPVLLAEDSDFFRAQVKKYLEEAGFQVFDAPPTARPRGRS